MRRATTALLAALLLGAAGDAGDAPAPPGGTWKFVFPLNTPPRALWLLKFTREDGRWSGAVTARAEGEPKEPGARPEPIAPSATLTGLSVVDGNLRFTLRTQGQVFRFEGKLPGESGVPLLGSATVSGDVVPVRLEPTALTSLDPYSLAKEILASKKEGVEAFRAAMTLLGGATELKAKPEEVRAWAERAAKVAEPYGTSWRRDVLLSVAELLVSQGSAAAAVPYARQAERLLEESDPVSLKKRTLDTLAAALERSGKADEAKQVRGRAAGLDFAVKPTPYAGPRGGRVALVELFTGAQCPPCVAADLAFDALGQGFKPTEVVRLEYHLHVPGPDPLTSPAALARQRFYGDAVEGAPTVFVSGRRANDPGGPRSDAPDKYTDLAGLAAGVVEQPAKATLKVAATRKGNKVEIKADVSDLRQTGETVRLRLALVENEVEYASRNGLPGYQNVVRDFPGGANGTPLPDKTASKTVTVDLDALRKELAEYLDKFAEENPFPGKARPLALKNLSVVAFIQNDANGEVLQAAQAEVTE
jgi:hypothetical protein